VGQSTKVAGGVGMTGWAQRAGVVLLAVTAWTASGRGGPVTPGGPDAVAQKLAAAETPAAIRARGSAGWPDKAEIAAVERDLSTDAALLASTRRAEPGPRMAMEPGGDGPPTEAPAHDGVAPGQSAAADGAQPRRLQDTEVTVLLWLAPGSYGIRRGYRTADPILCVADGCYVSRGPERPARFLPGRRALGFVNTWGERAGACRDALMCVFRAVDLGRLPGYLQPVDLHVLRHDRRRGARIGADSSCRLEFGRLACQHGLATEDYALWVVPEPLAAAAGPVVLQRALAEGLGEPGESGR